MFRPSRLQTRAMRRGLVLLCLLSFASLLLSCGETPTPQPTLLPAATATATPAIQPTLPPVATPTVGIAQASATPRPMASPTLRAVILPPQAPILIRREPALGEEHKINQPLRVTFDQPMNQVSVEQAFQIRPAVDGKFSWQQNTVYFVPTGEFQRDTTYEVTIGETATSARGLALPQPIAFRFRTVGYLQVTDVQPAPDITEVDMQADIIVSFNRPVVPLTAIDRQAELPQPLRFAPPVAGKGEWLNTSIYVFHPEGGLLPATTYQVSVAGGLTDLTGGVLPEDYVWSFTTKLPAVAATKPFSGAIFVAPTEVISVTFNQPMDPLSTAAAFSLSRVDGQRVAGLLRWEGDTLLFAPAAPLSLGVTYNARVSASAQAASGGKTMARDYTWRFTVIPEPAITGTRPSDGEKNASPYTDLELTFSGPVDPRTLLPNLTIIPEPMAVYTYWGESNTRVWVSFGARPSTAYRVTIGADLSGRYGHKLGQPYSFSFTTGPLSPEFSLAMLHRIGVYNAYTETVILASHVNVSQATLALYKLSRDELVRLSDDWQAWNKYRPSARNQLRRWSVPLHGGLNERRQSQISVGPAEGESLAPGLYYLQIDVPGIEQPTRHMMVVTRTNLVLKHGRTELLLWATDLRTAKPLSNLRVEALIKGEDTLQGRTDSQGIFRAALPEHDLWQPLYAFVWRGDELSAVASQWDNGIQPWQFELPVNYYSEPYNGVIYTDRPIYRPGQTVYFKGIVRTDDDGRYGLPDLAELRLVIYGSDGKELYNELLPVSNFGTFNGQFALSDQAALGEYQISIRADEGLWIPPFSAFFQVAEYRKPEFLVDVQADREACVQGDTIAVNVASSYYFGGALRDAAVQWRLLSQDYYFQWAGKGWWDFADQDLTAWQRPYTPYGELVTEGRGRTDDEGRFTFQLPASLGKRAMSQIFTIEATVTDVNNQEVSARTSAIVHRGLFYIGLQPQGYVGTAGRAQKVNIITVDTEGITVTNVALQVVAYEHRWYSVQERGPEGRLSWTTKAEDIPIYTTTVTTNDRGMAVMSFVPEKGGTYRIRASGRDERGSQISASTYVWVSSEEYTSWPRENHDRIELVPDQKGYAPGDTAHILVPSPYQGQTTALLTIERGHILEHRVVTLASNSEQIVVPITSEHIPNIYVSLYILKGEDATNPLASFKLGYALLSVSPREKELQITLTADRETYKPGDVATYEIRATDYSGRPVEAELSLALVDLSALALSGDQGPDLMSRFYSERGLGIQTASSLSISHDIVVVEKETARDAKGGDGGEGGLAVRQDFPDTVYWNPAVRTDAQGRAQVQAKLADNLTTWRMRAVAVTQETQVGAARADIVTTKELLIRPVTPRFFVIGDRAQLAAIVHNNTDRDIAALVKLEAAGVEVSNVEQQITVAAHGIAKVTWDVVVQPVSEVDLVFSVSGGGLADAARPVFGVLPVYHYSTPEVVATAGQVEGSEQRVEVVQLPDNLDATLGDLTLKLEPSLAAGMRDALTYVKTYPYDCIEQTVSRFLPNVIMYRALNRLGIRNEELEAELPKMVSTGLQRIYALQHYDGGWGWWVSDESNPYISAYVLFGLNEARRAGFAVDEDTMGRAASYLEKALQVRVDAAQTYPANARAYMIYVLAEYYADREGMGDLGRAITLYEQRDTLDHYGKAYLAMALRLMASSEQTRPKALLSDLTTAAIRSATGAHWEEKAVDHWAMNTDVRSTAIVLQALLRLQPDQPLIPNVVRWLMAARREGRWATTQETALAVMALTDYMASTGELAADYTYLAALNGELWDQGKVTAENVAEPRTLRVAVSALLREIGNQVWLQREAATGQTGEGRLYYSLYLRYYLPADQVKALNRGVILSRQYTLLDDPAQPLDQVKVGDIIQVKLTIIAPNTLHYLVVEDPLPAGCEAIDTSLKTTSAVYQGPEVKAVSEKGRLPYWWYFRHSELRDEKVALFATLLPAGTYEYTYLMRASIPGQFLAMPSYGYEMYFPEVFGRSDGARLVIGAE